ncbi:unnamed protein product [Brassicogethes aeneus]|uniref:Uncharacterized protein n=1 Tax=Brassicogethes aeneus TaxID=1431903 RepID=A0A9P0AXL8_BRAAE|nr:unnamed protein product [Brassicogethes aeneus]
MDNVENQPSVTKNKSGQYIGQGQRKILFDVVKKHITTGKSKSSSVKLTSEETGISKGTIWATIKQIEQEGKATSPSKKRKRSSQYEKLNEEQKMHLGKIVHNFFMKNETPNLSKIHQVVKDDDNLPPISRTNLWRILKKLEIECEKKELLCTMEQIIVKKEPKEPKGYTSTNYDKPRRTSFDQEMPSTSGIAIKQESNKESYTSMNYDKPRPTSFEQEMPLSSRIAIKQEIKEALENNDFIDYNESRVKQESETSKDKKGNFDGAQQVKLKFTAKEEMFLEKG